MERADELDAYHWLEAGYQPPPCNTCHGKDANCDRCHGTGRGAPVFSRTVAIRRAQEASGHQPCYGFLNKPDGAAKPSTCGELDCRFRRSCIGLHSSSRYHSDRIREDSIEYLSGLFLNARAIERRSSDLTPFQATVANLIQHWVDDTPQVAVLGAFSAGKSTLLNRLIGKSLLPATRTPTTAVVTSIRYGDQPRGVLYFRAFARLTLISQDARSPDPAALQAMRSWIRSPERYGVLAIREVDEQGAKIDVDRVSLLRELDALAGEDNESGRTTASEMKRRVPKRGSSPTDRLTRTFEVQFEERRPQELDLSSDEKIVEFHPYLTEPSLALSLNRAVCYFPDPRLESLNFLDTAGLCSPVGFHKDVTDELLKRRPDKMLVLLDSRRLDSPTNASALKVLGRFVTVPDDYRQVTFALTFWDLALQTHMMEDSEPELDFASPQVRKEADMAFARSKRRELASLLGAAVGVKCASEPMIFTLGLGLQAPPEMRRTLDFLWRHLESDCGGWVGVEMWAERWRAALGYASQLLELHRAATEDVEEAKSKASDITDLNAELERLKAQEQCIVGAVHRYEKGLQELVEAHKQRMLVEVRSLDSQSGILAYLDSVYWKSANSVLDALQEDSRRAKISLVELHRGARELRLISLDRKLLGLGSSERQRVRNEVTGFFYGLKSIWDFFLGGVYEFNADNRNAAREILRGEVLGFLDHVIDAVNVWAEQATRFQKLVSAEYADKREALSARKGDSSRYVDRLQKKLNFLTKSEPPLRDLCLRIDKFADKLGEAKARIEASRQTDFRAFLLTEDGRVPLRRGREQDLLLLNVRSKSRWQSLEIRSDGLAKRFIPVARGDGRWVAFFDVIISGKEDNRAVVAPERGTRFELRLSTLEGRFFSNKRDVPRRQRSKNAN